MYLVGSHSDLYPVSATAVMYSISCHIKPCYIQLYYTHYRSQTTITCTYIVVDFGFPTETECRFTNNGKRNSDINVSFLTETGQTTLGRRHNERDRSQITGVSIVY